MGMSYFVMSRHQTYKSECKKMKVIYKGPTLDERLCVFNIEKEMILQSRFIHCSKCFDKKDLI